MINTRLLDILTQCGGIKVDNDGNLTVDNSIIKLFKGRGRLKKKKAKKVLTELVTIAISNMYKSSSDNADILNNSADNGGYLNNSGVGCDK